LASKEICWILVTYPRNTNSLQVLYQMYSLNILSSSIRAVEHDVLAISWIFGWISAHCRVVKPLYFHCGHPECITPENRINIIYILIGIGSPCRTFCINILNILTFEQIRLTNNFYISALQKIYGHKHSNPRPPQH